VVSVTPRPRFTPGERTPGTHWIGGWVGPRAGLDAGARRKILCPCRGSNPDRPARSQTLYCLSYRGSIILRISNDWLIYSRFINVFKLHYAAPTIKMNKKDKSEVIWKEADVAYLMHYPKIYLQELRKTTNNIRDGRTANHYIATIGRSTNLLNHHYKLLCISDRLEAYQPKVQQ
jgi:hypothetical protein